MWSQIERAIMEFGWRESAAGICRVHKLGQLLQQKARSDDLKEVSIIVREEAMPLFDDDENDPTGKDGEPEYPATSYTYDKLGIPKQLRGNITWRAIGQFGLKKSAKVEPDWEGLKRLLRHDYDMSDEEAEEKTYNLFAFWGMTRMIGHVRSAEEYLQQEIIDRPTAINESEIMLEATPKSWITQGVVSLLQALLESDVMLRDLHMLNLGWRVHSFVPGDQIYIPLQAGESEDEVKRSWQQKGNSVEGMFGGELPVGICLYDPGFTPTHWRPRMEQLLVKNPRRRGGRVRLLSEEYADEIALYGSGHW